MAWYETLAVFDTETTGVDTETARIVSANVSVIGPDGAVIERRDWIADPGVEIPDAAAAVHGISTERARAEGRPPVEVVAEIVESLRDVLGRGLALVVYNAPYDITLLNREALRHGVPPLVDPAPIIDPFVLDKAVDRYRKGKRTLEVCAELYGVELVGAHDAGADAIAAGRVAQALARKFPDDLDIDAHDLHGRQAVWAAASAASFQEWKRNQGFPEFVAHGTWPEHPQLPAVITQSVSVA